MKTPKAQISAHIHKIFSMLCIVLLQACLAVPKLSEHKNPFDELTNRSDGKAEGIVGAATINASGNLVIQGSKLSGVNELSVVFSNGVKQKFSIISKTGTTIVAGALSAFSVAVGSAFSILISDAKGASTFPVTVTMADGSIDGAKIAQMGASNGDVLAYNGVSGKWEPTNLNGITFQGTWDARTAGQGGPDIDPSGGPVSGDYYVVSQSGSHLVDGINTWVAGDWALYDGGGAVWTRVQSGGGVMSFNGRSGNVSPQAGDYTWAQINKATSTIDDITDVDTSTAAPTNGQVLKWNNGTSKWEPANDSDSGSTLGASIETGEITDGTIDNADVNAGANIALTKLNWTGSSVDVLADVDTTTSAPTNGQVLKWNNGASKWEPAADSDTGSALGASIETGEITDGTIDNADVNAAAAIAWTKISKTGASVDDLPDVDTTTSAPTNGQVLKWNNGASKWEPGNDSDTGSALGASIETGEITDGTIDNADVNAGANIALTKLNWTGSSVDVLADVDTTTSAPTNGQVLKWNNGASKWEPAADSDTGSALGASIETSEITDGTIDNADVNAGANIALTKLNWTGSSVDVLADVDTTTSAPTNGQVLKWNNGASKWEPAADSDSGAALGASIETGEITDGTIDNADVNAGANIALTKLNWTGSSVDVLADVDTTTSAPTNGQVLKWNNGASKWEPAADSDTVSALGASIETGEITDGTIDNADVNAAAAIAWTKISKTGASVDDLPDVDTTTSAPTNGQVLKWNNGASKWEPANDSDTVSTLGASIETGEITDGTIANADINAGAAIAWGKIDKAGAGAADVGAAPAGRNLAAGAGLTGGGTLAADRVFNVNVDGATMEVNADAIRVKDGGITNAKLSTGSVGSLKINNGSILDIDINAGAAINWGKISKVGSTVDHIADVDTTTVAPTNGQVLKWNNGASKWEPANDSDTGLALGTSIETGEITNGTIANVDINAAAAIAWTKISKAGAVPADIGAAVGTTTMTAGAGLTGGGDLTNNRTFNVNPDGLSLEINADQVRIKALGVTTALIANANVTNAKITNNAVNSVKISDGSVTGADIAVDTITAVDVAADAIGSSELQNNSVGVNEIVTNGVGSAEVVDNSLTATDLAANSVTASEIATGAVGSAEVVDNSLTATDLAANSVTASEIAADAVGASEIATGAVGTSEIATNGVGAAEIAANAVGSSEMNFAHADFKQVLSAGINFTGTTVTKLSECGSTYIATGGSCQVTGCGQWELVYSGWGDTTNKDNWKCQAKRKGGTSTCTLKARVICLLQ